MSTTALMGQTSAYVHLTPSEYLTPTNYLTWSRKLGLAFQRMHVFLPEYIETGTVRGGATSEEKSHIGRDLDAIIQEAVTQTVSVPILARVSQLPLFGRGLWLFLQERYGRLSPLTVVQMLRSVFGAELKSGAGFRGQFQAVNARLLAVKASVSPNEVWSYMVLALCDDVKFVQYVLEHSTDPLASADFVLHLAEWEERYREESNQPGF